MTKSIQDFKMEFHKELDTWKKIQATMKMEWESPVAQLENSKESHTSRLNQAEDGLKDKVEDVQQINKEYEKF